METTNHLQHLTEQARRAHYWTSFSPEKRGDQLIKDYNEELNADIDFLQANGISTQTIEEYKEKFIRLFSSYLGAKSRVASPMITGPANFPTRRNEKANRSEQRHYEVFAQWRERAKRAIVRKSKPEKTFSSEYERYVIELEGLKKNHELMKEGNRRIKQAHKTGEDLTGYLTEVFNIKPHMIDWTMKFGFGLSNNLASIKRIEERIELMKVKQHNAQEIGANEFIFDGFKVIFNHEADRIQIQHDVKPSAEVIYRLKSNGFRWSPRFTAWQRQLNQNGKWAAERVLNIKLS